MKGTIQQDGNVKGEDGKLYLSERRGTDKEGFSEILIDAKAVGLNSSMSRQSVKPLIGMTVEFQVSPAGQGYNYVIVNNKCYVMIISMFGTGDRICDGVYSQEEAIIECDKANKQTDAYTSYYYEEETRARKRLH